MNRGVVSIGFYYYRSAFKSSNLWSKQKNCYIQNKSHKSNKFDEQLDKFNHNSHCRRKMYTSLVILLSLAALTEASSEVRFVRLNDDHLIDSGRQNYVLVSPKLARFTWKGLAVNGDRLAAYDESCQLTDMSIETLQGVDRYFIESLRDRLAGNERQQERGLFNLLKFPLQSASFATTALANGNLITLNNNDGQMIILDDTTTVSKESLPGGFARVFKINDLVVISYLNGGFWVKPEKCLQEDEIELMRRVNLHTDENSGFHRVGNDMIFN